MADDVLLNKVASIVRCLERIAEEYKDLGSDFSPLDLIIFNLQRARETTIDIAMYLVRVNRLGVPQENRNAFRMLEERNLLPSDLSASM